jgi:acetolactate synthase-1/2/3 large subunit
MPPDQADANGDLPMTEQMTGRKEPEGTERPPGAAAGPSAPSPRDLAARSPHHPAARDAQPRPAEAPHSAPPQAAGSVPPQAAAAEPPRAQVTSPGKVRATGAQALVYALERVGADVVFGIPGGAVLPAYDPLLDSKSIRHILVRHEQGAGHAATGYAQATGRVGVCMATSGPGATNLVTPIADAYMDSVPVVAITGQVSTNLIGTDGFQEADISGITIPVTKHNFLVTRPEDIARTIGEAFHVASTGRPGPVLVDIAKDAMQASTDFVWPVPFDLPGYHPVTRPHARQVREAARLISESRRPVLYVGGGVIKARAAGQLRELAELTGIPVVTTLMARGAFPDGHPQHMGMPGMHGTVAAVGALQKADLLIALGTRFDDRVTGKLDTFAPAALIVHADIDPAEISKNRRADVPIVGDCREVIADLIAAVRAEFDQGRRPDLDAWRAQLDSLRSTYPLGYDEPDDGTLAPQHVIERIGKIAGPEAIYVAGVGQHQMWAAQFIDYENPGTWINSGGLGTMGFAVPAAMGAKMGRPDTTVWAIDGDGCFQMTNQELATCAIEGIPIKVAIINNGSLGMVRQWQTLFYAGAQAGRHPHPRLRQARRGLRLRGHPLRGDGRRGHGDRAGHGHRGPPGRDRLHRAQGRHGLAHGRGRHQQQRHQVRARPGARLGRLFRMTRHTLSVLVENKPGVLVRIAGLFARRGFNIDSLAVGPTEHEEISRITIVVNCEEHPLEQVTKQLNKLINVLKIVELEPGATVQRELILIKVRADAESRSRVLEAVGLFRAKVVDVALDVITVEATGNHEKLDALIKVLEPFGIKELVQSGMVAIGRGGRSITDRALRPVERSA